MEKNERSTEYYEIARDICASEQKRLPSPSEWKFACENPPVGLTGMTGNSEWAQPSSGDSLFFMNVYGLGTQHFIGAPLLGFTNCRTFWVGKTATSDSLSDSANFRCVR